MLGCSLRSDCWSKASKVRPTRAAWRSHITSHFSTWLVASQVCISCPRWQSQPQWKALAVAIFLTHYPYPNWQIDPKTLASICPAWWWCPLGLTPSADIAVPINLLRNQTHYYSQRSYEQEYPLAAKTHQAIIELFWLQKENKAFS